MPEDPDWAWIGKFYDGDQGAFNELFRKHQTRALNLAFRFTRDRQSAEDIVQEVFLRIYERKVSADPSAKFSTWLYRVVVNASLDLVRRKKTLFFRSFDEERNSGESESGRTLAETVADPAARRLGEGLAEREVEEALRREIDRLPDKYRAPILLYQFEEMPYRDIARILGISEKAVERRLSHAKERLKKRLQAKGF
ncbi:MAG: RNA polymerase sigma factor [Candidatus Omnitrophica bacterium]|nr:RNA polymerase sigma factor [Candidatus Omnitrophota bacterium]